MKRAARIAWGFVAALVLLVIGLTWQGASGWLTRGGARIEQGRAAGLGRDDVECVSRALESKHASHAIGDAMGDSLWLSGCLLAARRTTLCNGVPPSNSVLEAGAWVASTCEARAGAGGRCQVVLQAVLRHCDPDRSQGPSGKIDG